MTKIKLCGMSRAEDILAANELLPDYIGFVFAPNSKRYVSPENALRLRAMLCSDIKAVGVFVDEKVERVAELLKKDIIDLAQLHGSEDNGYIARLRELTDKPIIKAFRIASDEDIAMANESPADTVLLDAGAGDGMTFNWSLLKNINRPYFLAGGLSCENIGAAVSSIHPYGVDVSSGIETNGNKDKEKMAVFVAEVRKEDKR